MAVHTRHLQSGSGPGFQGKYKRSGLSKGISRALNFSVCLQGTSVANNANLNISGPWELKFILCVYFLNFFLPGFIF